MHTGFSFTEKCKLRVVWGGRFLISAHSVLLACFMCCGQHGALLAQQTPLKSTWKAVRNLFYFQNPIHGQVKAYSTGKTLGRNLIGSCKVGVNFQKYSLLFKRHSRLLHCDIKLSQTKTCHAETQIEFKQTDSLKWTDMPSFVSCHYACHGTLIEGLILMLTNGDCHSALHLSPFTHYLLLWFRSEH